MKITINDQRKILAVQKEFNSVFPALRLEFYARPSKVGASHSTKLVGHRGKTLLQCRSSHQEGILEVDSNMSIEEMKDHFRDTFGLSVEIIPVSTSKGAGVKNALVK